MPVSTRIRDNKLITIYRSFEFDYVKVKVFELKEGPIENVYKNMKTFDIGRIDSHFTLRFLEIPDNFQEDKNKVWLKFETSLHIFTLVSPFMNWVGYLNLNDMSLENSSDFIKFPTDESFPVRGYTINTITNELGSALYIAGGQRYSKKDKTYSISDSFYKYNFTSKEWMDMTYSVEGRLNPLTDHNSVVIDNKYLVLLGGVREVTYDSRSERRKSERNSLYNLTIFDTITNKWEYINIEADIFYLHVTTVKFDQFLATAYKDKIFVLGGSAFDNLSNATISNEHLGIFDFKSKSWNWTPILNEDSSSYKKGRVVRDIQVLNDQLIICTDISEGESYIPIFVYDMASHRMKSTLKLTNSSNDANSINDKNEAQNQSKTLPIYAIVLIAISCTVLLASFIYLLYRKVNNKQITKNRRTRSNGPIREVWANPDIDNTNNIITFDKMNFSNTIYSNGFYQNSET